MIDDQFVSDAWNSLDPKPTAKEIVELWLDQNDPPEGVDEQALIETVKYYLPIGAK